MAQGGILTGITLLLTCLGYLFSLVELFGYIALSPIVIAGVLRGPAFSLQVGIASSALVCMIWGFFPAGLSFFISIVPYGVALGHFFNKKTKPARIVLHSVVILSISLIVLFWISTRISGIDFDRDFQSIAHMIHRSTSWVAEYFMLLLPSLVFFTALCYSFYIWLFNSYLLERVGLMGKRPSFLIDIPDFFKLPRYLIFFLLGGLVFYLAYRVNYIPAMRFIGVNLVLITSILFFFKGMYEYGRSFKEKWGRGMSFFFFLFAITAGIPLLVGVGLISTLFKKENRMMAS